MIEPLASPTISGIVALVQDYSFVIWIGVGLCEIIWMCMHPKHIFRGWGILALAIHNVIYYAVAINVRDGNFSFGLDTASTHVVMTSWSAILRAHSGTTLIFLGIERIEWKKVWETCKGLFLKVQGGLPWKER